MSLIKELDSVVESYRSEIGLIGEFVVSTESPLRASGQVHGPLSPMQRRALREFSDTLAMIESGDFDGPVQVSVCISEIVRQIVTPVKQRTFLAEMALSYIVSHQEAFIKDYVYQLLIHRKDLLKSSGTISLEEIGSLSSVKRLIRTLAQKQVDRLGYYNIDDLAKYFQKRMNIAINEFESWQSLREISYRRNVIIHNQAVANDLYCAKTKCGSCGDRLGTDSQYVCDAIKVILGFIDFLHSCVKRKFRLRTTTGQHRMIEDNRETDPV